MVQKLLKVAPGEDASAEEQADLAYYAALTTAERFRMTIERSILLLRIAARNETDKASAALVKRR